MSGAIVCRFCGCGEGNPCTVEDGDACILNVRTGVCSAPACRRAEIAAAEAVRMRRRQEQRLGPWKVVKRNERGRATRIVRRRKPKGRAA